MVDTLRFPFLNDKNTIGITYYTAWQSGLSYFDGGTIDYYYCMVSDELAARENGTTVDYGPDATDAYCEIPEP